MHEDRHSFGRQVALKASRKLAARRAGEPGAWSGFGMFGMVGWTIALPTVCGALLGRWLDGHHAGGTSWTLTLLVAGLVVGCATAWHFISDNPGADAQPRDDDE